MGLAQFCGTAVVGCSKTKNISKALSHFAEEIFELHFCCSNTNQAAVVGSDAVGLVGSKDLVAWRIRDRRNVVANNCMRKLFLYLSLFMYTGRLFLMFKN